MSQTAILEEFVQLINVIAVAECRTRVARLRIPSHRAELRTAADEPQETGRRKNGIGIPTSKMHKTDRCHCGL